jgi:hypothetical protein
MSDNMKKRRSRCLPAMSILAAMVFVAGCQDRGNTTATKPRDAAAPAEPIADTPAVPANDKRKAVAEKAKEALFAGLSGRLKEVLQSQGPAAAIDVCSQEATEIAGTVGKQHGVEIGRTSFKLRNPANAPRDWVKPFVEKRVDTPQYVPLDSGKLGALFPIRLDVKCLMCHGQPDEMLDEVKPELAKRYPDDAATGFKQGDLRGWFWVEVPESSTP